MRILETQRAEARVRDLGMFAGEIAGQRARRIDVRTPVDGAHRLVEGARRSARSNSATTRNTRLATRDSRQARYATVERPGELHAQRAFAHVGGAELAQLARQQVAETARTGGHEPHAWRFHRFLASCGQRQRQRSMAHSRSSA